MSIRQHPTDRHVRWRLILGSGSEKLGPLGPDDARRSQALSFLYDRERGGQGGQSLRSGPGSSGPGKQGGTEAPTLTIPDWINDVHELFPRRTFEIIEEDALQRYGLTEMITNGELLQKVQPSTTLLKAIMQSKHLMNQEVLEQARNVVRQVVNQLRERIKPRIVQSFSGKRDPQRRSMHKVARNFDAQRTIKANLKNYSTTENALIISEPYFVARVRRESEKYQVIIVVDQSASMADSVIHAVVTASIFHGLSSLKTHLIAFSTEVVDFTNDVTDPVELLMKIQLGGGTDIAEAVTYAGSLITNPKRAIVVLISDLEEGGNPAVLVNRVHSIVAGGSKVLALAALNTKGEARYSRDIAQKITKAGAKVAALSPEHLADWVAEVVG